MENKLYRSRTDRMICGVCGGLAKYFNVDPVLVRIIFVLLILAHGLGILAYIIIAIVVPLEGSRATSTRETTRENIEEIKATAVEFGEELRATFTRKDKPAEEKTEATKKSRQSQNLLGIILIAIGLLILMGTMNLFWWFRWDYLWPVLLIIVGLLIIINTWRKK